MLQLLVGPSGSGKTSRLLQQIEAHLRTGVEKIILITPEQHSFESERLLLTRFSPREAARVQVYSFTRLAEQVFREVGGVAGARLDEGVRALLMSRALEQVAVLAGESDTPLRGLRSRLSADPAYVEQLLSLWEEVRRCAVPTEELNRVAEELAGDAAGTLADKLAELYRVFSVYEGLAASSGLDEADLLTRLTRCLPDSELPGGAVVLVDGFKGFTVQELAVLGALIPRVAEMTVALCSDTPGAGWPGTPREACRREYTLFSPVTDTVAELRRLAESHARQWTLVELTDNHRGATPGLRALEAGLYAPNPTVYEGDATEVALVPCEDVYEECTAVVRRIRRLLREEGYRCREIAVVVRDLPGYAGLLDTALVAEGIPCYMDTRTDLLCEGLVVYLRAALRLAVGGWRTEQMLRLLKTDLSPLSPVEVARLENYVYTWRIEGSAWEQDWTENPAGLGEAFTERERAVLATLNSQRAQIMKALTTLRKALHGEPTGHQFALAMYRFLTADKDLPGRVAAQVACLEELAQPVLAEQVSRLWEAVIGVLDRFALALGDQRIAASRLEELFTLLCRTVDMGHIPQGLDAVTVGSADRMRYNNPRAVFILGANEGVFPAYPAENALLTEEERQVMKARGLTLSADLLRQCVEERYYVYTAVSAPRERLTVLYRTGGDTAPSPLVTAIRQILPGCAVEAAALADGTDLETRRESFQRLAESYAYPTAVTASLRQVVAEDSAYGPRLAAVERAAADAPFRMEERAVTERLFGTDMCLSPTQTEKFYNCPFSYFCEYGLQVQPRRVAQVDHKVFGTLVHMAMETLLPVYITPGGLVDTLKAADDAGKDAAATEDRTLMTTLREDVHRVVEAYLQAEMGGLEEKSGQFRYQVGLAERSACNMLWHTLMELRQSDFVPKDFELSITPEEEAEEDSVLSLRLPTSVGSVQVRGKVDRVDLFVRFDGTAFVRVVDYKTGKKIFDLSEVTAGLSMQMLLYLFILCDNSRRYLEEGGELRPAGALYHPLSDLSIKRGETTAHRLKSMKMTGLVLDDAAVVLAMEKDGDENFIPACLDKGGKPKGSVVTLQQFYLLRGVVEKLLTGMAERLLEGDIAALPLQKGEHKACSYCAYQAVCGRDEDSPTRALNKRSMRDILTDLEKEADGDGEA